MYKVSVWLISKGPEHKINRVKKVRGVASRGELTKALALRAGARLGLLLLVLVEGAKHIATPGHKM